MKSSRPGLRLSFAALLAASFAAVADDPLPRVELKAGAHRLDVEVASTPAQRARGLMGRTQLADNAGMLFVFEDAGRHCFWMKDTPLPLSVAFLADDGTIVGIADMRPQTTDLHCAPVPVRYAVEVGRGRLANRGITSGARLSGGPLGTTRVPRYQK